MRTEGRSLICPEAGSFGDKSKSDLRLLELDESALPAKKLSRNRVLKAYVVIVTATYLYHFVFTLLCD